MERKLKHFNMKLILLGATVLSIFCVSFFLNSYFQKKELNLIESLSLLEETKFQLIDFELSSESKVKVSPHTLKEAQKKVLILKSRIQNSDFAKKYFSQSQDLSISYEQYLLQVEKGQSDKSKTEFIGIIKDFEQLDRDILEEMRSVSLLNIIWNIVISFIIIFSAFLGIISLRLGLKVNLRGLKEENENLLTRLKALRSGASIAEWSLDLESLMLKLSADATDLLEMNFHDVNSSLDNFLSYFEDESAKKIKEDIFLCTKTGDHLSIRAQKKNAEGKGAWVNISGLVISEDDKTKMVGQISDIDESNQAHERFKLLFQHITQPAFISGEHGIVECNNATLRFFKMTKKEDFLAKKLVELYPLNQPDNRGSLEYFKYHMKRSQEDKRHRFGWTFRQKDGEVSAEVQLFPIVLENELLYLHLLKEDNRHLSVVKDRQHRVIICDPNIHSRNIIQGYFEAEDWLVKSTDSFSDALFFKEEHFFDLVIVDFSIANLDLELFRLNQNKTHLVGMGTGDEDSFHRGKVDSFFMKPIRKEIILGLIHKVSESSEKLIVDDVMDLYVGKHDVLVSYCNELEIYLEEFDEQFNTNLDFDEWDSMRDSLLILQTISKKFSCRGLNALFEKSFSIIGTRDNSQIRTNHKKVLISFKELIGNIRAELRKHAA